MTFSDKTFKSVFWKFLERGFSNGAQFVISIVLARLLMPSDYGTIAILSIFIAVSQTIVEGGLSQVLIQDQERIETDFTSMFLTNLALSIFFYFLLFISSPFIADFYNIPELTLITRVYSLIIIINGFSIVARTRSNIELKFKEQAKINLISILISGACGILLAYLNFSVWALVFQQLINGIATTILFCKSEPGISSWKINYSRMINNFLLGYKILTANLLQTIYSNLQPLIIGKVYSASSLGLFSRGDQMIKIIPLNITEVFGSTMFPIFCQYKNNLLDFKDKFLKYIGIISYFFFPVIFILILISRPLILIVLTDKWEGCVVYMQILGFAYLLDPILRLNSYIPTVFGDTSTLLKCEFVKKIFAFCILISTSFISIIAVCIGMCFYSVVDLFTSTYFNARVSGIGLLDEFKHFVFPLIINVVLFFCFFFVNNYISNYYLLILIDVLCYLLIYIILLVFLDIEEFNLVYKTIKQKGNI